MVGAKARDVAAFEKKAADLTGFPRTFGNARRLMVLCRLAEAGEATVGALVEAVGGKEGTPWLT
jgi:ArsR family transcriptional regulator